MQISQQWVDGFGQSRDRCIAMNQGYNPTTGHMIVTLLFPELQAQQVKSTKHVAGFVSHCKLRSLWFTRLPLSCRLGCVCRSRHWIEFQRRKMPIIPQKLRCIGQSRYWQSCWSLVHERKGIRFWNQPESSSRWLYIHCILVSGKSCRK